MQTVDRIAERSLFPQGRLVEGRIALRQGPVRKRARSERDLRPRSLRPLTRDALRTMFHALEKAVGIRPIIGRGWYGVRRRAQDMAEDVTPDDRVLNAISGHETTRMRREYQEHRDPVITGKAAEARRALRRWPPPAPVPAPDGSELGQVQNETPTEPVGSEEVKGR